jgi:hypothetical protein
MAQVIEVADQQAVNASQQLLFGVTDIGQEVDNLREVVEKFIEAVRIEASERRRFERFDGNSAEATLMLPGQQPVQVTVKDLSRGGAALWTKTSVPAGIEIAIDLPHAGGLVKGKVVRFLDDRLSVAFDQDAETSLRVESALRELSAGATNVGKGLAA